MGMISWRDLRNKCKMCDKCADFDVEYSNEDLPEGYLRDGTRIVGYCLDHLPQEVSRSKESMLKAAQQPF